MINTLESKIDRLEREINRCLQEKRQCDVKLAKLENQHLQVVSDSDRKTSARDAADSEIQIDQTDIYETMAVADNEHLRQMVALNGDIQGTMASLEQTIKEMQSLLGQLTDTYLPNSSSVFEHNSMEVEEIEIDDAGETEPAKDSVEAGDSDALLGLLSGLLESPAVIKMLPTLLKQFAK